MRKFRLVFQSAGISIISLLLSQSLTAQSAPVITGISPASGPIGTKVTVRGRNFTDRTNSRVVLMGDAAATVLQATDTTLLVEVPAGATSSKLSVTANNLTYSYSLPFIPTFPSNGSTIDFNSFAPRLSFPAGSLSGKLATADFDKNGSTDLVVSNTSNSLTVLRNLTTTIGSINLDKPSIFSAGSSVNVCTGDIDGDGKIDVVAPDQRGYAFNMYRNVSTADSLILIKDYVLGTVPQAESPHFAYLGDLDGDGKPDLVAITEGRRDIIVFRNTSTPGKISFGSRFNMLPYGSFNNLLMSDLDQDGRPELIISVRTTSDIKIFHNKSIPGNIIFDYNFALGSQYNLAMNDNSQAGNLCVADFDGDGKPDIACGYENDSAGIKGGYKTFKNFSTPGTISFGVPVTIPLGGFMKDILASDIDGDGKPDIAMVNRTTNSITLLKNRSTGQIVMERKFDYPLNQPINSLSWADFDADGKPDLAVTYTASDSVSLLRNTTGERTITPMKIADLKAVNIASTFAYLDWTKISDPGASLNYEVNVFYGGFRKTVATKNSNITLDSLNAGKQYSVLIYAKNNQGIILASSDTLSFVAAASAAGLQYRYFEGDWNSLPDFDSIKPIKTGKVANINLDIKNRDDYFGVVWEGMINIPRQGNYTFEVLSDDGSKLYIDSFYSHANRPLIDNDGLHWALKSGTINNLSAGLHPFALSYFEKWGGETMEIYWTGPGIPRQRIPESAFVETPPGEGNIEYAYYEGDWDRLPDFEKLSPVIIGKSKGLDLSKRKNGVDDYYGFVWNGFIKLNAPGEYKFETVSDDGSRFYFNSHYSNSLRPAVDNDGLHGEVSASSIIKVPSAGVYPISATFFEKWGGESMKLYYSGPNLPRQEIPGSAFVTKPGDNINPGVPTNLKVQSSGDTFIKFTWDAASDDQLVTGYAVYVNGSFQYTVTSPEIVINDLVPKTAYEFQVSTIDQAGNRSALSEKLTQGSPVANAGLNYKYYEGDWNTLPDFNALTPVKTGVVPNLTLSMRNSDDYFGVLYEGFLTIPVSDVYRFELPSDDGSRFYLTRDYSFSAQPLINNDGLHGDGTSPSATIFLYAGSYKIAIAYFEKWGAESLDLTWETRTKAKERIPAAYFTRVQENIVASNVSRLDVKSSPSDASGVRNEVSVYPNPFLQKLNVEFYSAENAHGLVEIFDASGRRVLIQQLEKIQKGKNQTEVRMPAQRLAAGLYTLKLTVDGKIIKTVQLIHRDK